MYDVLNEMTEMVQIICETRYNGT